LAAEARHLGGVFVHQVEEAVACAVVDKVRAVGMFVGRAGHAAPAVPSLLRDVELTSRRPLQPPVRSVFVADEIEQERTVEKIRRCEQLPSAVDLDELVVLDRVAEHSDVGPPDDLPGAVERTCRRSRQLEGLGRVGVADLESEEQSRRCPGERRVDQPIGRRAKQRTEQHMRRRIVHEVGRRAVVQLRESAVDVVHERLECDHELPVGCTDDIG